MNKKYYVTQKQAEDIEAVAQTLGLPAYDHIFWNGHYFVVGQGSKSVARIWIKD